ncbi:hypothetical protein ROLI_040570 [Roseobacter fucihabitans]|uniref:Uncharacterized protein n=1 Tax=Roseobacter fucihabitans TaxID=1537242 RepID=A0ABZ2BY05_9RHOB|nr:hypothetical protein [Roseobacter litoralis]MBC6965834.1 hypothetical protein [Roseobacter litoralis]
MVNDVFIYGLSVLGVVAVLVFFVTSEKTDTRNNDND